MDLALSEADIQAIMASTTFQNTLGESIKEALDKQLKESLNAILPNCMAPFFAQQTKQLVEGMDSRVQQQAALSEQSVAAAVSPLAEGLKQLEARVVNVEAADAAMGGGPMPAEMQQVLDRMDKQEAEIKRLPSSPVRSPEGSVNGASTPGGAWANGPCAAVLSAFSGGTFATPPRMGFSAPSGFSPLASSPGGANFDRATDPTIFKISATKPFTRTEATNIAQKIVREADIPPVEFDVEGISPGTTYVIRFKEPPDVAARHVNKALQSQKTGTAQWKRYEVRCPGDAPTAPGTSELLFLNADKNGRQVKLEVGARKLVTILKAKHPEQKFVCLSKVEGIVGLAEGKPWKAIAKISVLPPSNVEVYWNDDVAQSMGIGKPDAMSSFNSDIGFSSGFQWTKG